MVNCAWENFREKIVDFIYRIEKSKHTIGWNLEHLIGYYFMVETIKVKT